MKKQIVKFSLLICISALFISCALGPFMADMFSTDSSSVLTVNSIGAKAVAGIDSASRGISRGLDSRALEEDPVLVKFLEDGTIESIIETDTGGGTPDIAFITTGDDGSIYVGFSWVWWVWTGSTSQGIQFIRIHPDSSDYDVLWPPTGLEGDDINDAGQIITWNWWGMEYEPLVKGADGKLYFEVETWTSSTTSHKIYRYDPDTAEEPVLVTPESATLSIQRFMVDSKKHLFFQSEGWDSGAASYLRYYSDGSTGYQTIYYSSDNNTWIRGFTTSPTGDYIVINGSNIRGMNGIIKVSDLDNDDQQSYDLMYSESNGTGDWIHLYKYYNDSWENNTELIDQISQTWEAAAYEWRDDVKTGGVVDINKIYTKIQPYFYDTPSVKSGMESFVTGALSNSDGGHALYLWITNYAEEFLRTYFDGKLFKDWLDENGLNDLYFGNIGTMLWSTDGALYGLYDSGYWGSESTGTKIVKLLDDSGNRDLQVIDLAHGAQYPSLIKIEDDCLYYRYAVLDSYGEESGKHQLARLNFATNVEIEILPADLGNTIEVVSYDTSSSNDEVYFVGANAQTNEIINGKIDIASGTWSKIDTTLRFGSIKVIE